MEVLSLFDSAHRQQLIDRITQLQSGTQAQWGKMSVDQMLAHCQLPLQVALGQHQPKSSPLLRLIAPLFKSVLYNDKPFKKNLGTDPSFKIVESRNFDNEKKELINVINQFRPENMVSTKHRYLEI